MTCQQEYDQFMEKFVKTLHDIKKDFNDLSPETQQRVAQVANSYLKEMGMLMAEAKLISLLRGR